MKVCILSAYFLETTLPLAKHLSELNLDMTVYCLFHIENRNSYVVDFSPFKVNFGIDNRYCHDAYNDKIKEYLSHIKIYNFFISSITRNPIRNLYHIFKLLLHIRKQKFDIIHFIGNNSFEYLIWFFLRRKIKVHTLHEVNGHENNTSLNFIQRFTMNFLCRNKTNIITHSVATGKRFSEYYSALAGKKQALENRLHIIPFGLFETYGCFSEDIHIEEDAKTLVFFGRILPYKGIEYLFDAFQNVQKKIPEIKLIVAGEGEIDFDIKSLKNIEIINQFVNNYELVKIIKKASVIVCPYISASQSGVPMVAFYFGKPVITTNVGGLPEVVENMVTGLIVTPRDSEALAQAIEKVMSDSALLTTLKNNIKQKYAASQQYGWHDIAAKTKKVYFTDNN